MEEPWDEKVLKALAAKKRGDYGAAAEVPDSPQTGPVARQPLRRLAVKSVDFRRLERLRRRQRRAAAAAMPRGRPGAAPLLSFGSSRRPRGAGFFSGRPRSLAALTEPTLDRLPLPGPLSAPLLPGPSLAQLSGAEAPPTDSGTGPRVSVLDMSQLARGGHQDVTYSRLGTRPNRLRGKQAARSAEKHASGKPG